MASWMMNSGFRPTTVPCARLRLEDRACVVRGGFVFAACRTVPRSQEASVYPRRH